MMSPSVLFVRSRAEAEDLAKALGCDVLGAHLAIAERTAIIERFGSEGYMISFYHEIKELDRAEEC